MAGEHEIEVSMAGIGKYSANPDTPKLRDEVNDYLREHVATDGAALSRLSQEMAASGVINDLAIAEFSNIDGYGGRAKDGSIDLDELIRASKAGGDLTTMMAARHLASNRNEVTAVDNAGGDWMQWGINPLNWEIGGFGPGAWIEDKIEISEIDGYQRKQYENGAISFDNGLGLGDFDDFSPGGDAEEDGTPNEDDAFDKSMSPRKLKEAFADPDTSAEQRLQIAMALHENDVDSFTVEDKDGRELDISIRTKEGGQISLWVKGFEHPLMRGFVRDGKVSQQGSLNYYGDTWRSKYDEDETLFR